MLQKWVSSKLLDMANRGAFPRSQKRIWQWWYQAMAWAWRDRDWAFMNYGYLPADGTGPALDPADEQDRCFIGLYHKVLGGLDLQEQQVLEVGSGRGGGTAYVARYHRPQRIVGLDFSARAVTLARAIHSDLDNVEFRQGDAEHLPFDDATFDVVVNVESSHCYANMAAFVSEAARVLKPGGHLAWADIRGRGMMTRTEQAFAASGLALRQAEQINAGVVAALDAMHERKSRLIERHRLLRPLLREFSATRDARIFNGIKSGSVRYLYRLYQKPTSTGRT
jgi:ubiquinone/menaquinone biosynthesis C-methylase UbiE